MKILGIDYGRSKIGLALSEGSLAFPYKVIPATHAIEELRNIFQKENIDKFVVGISSGQMMEEQKRFAEELGAETFDETLTTKEAQRLSLEAGMSRKKRKGMEDAFAAALMLQSYLDSNV